MHNLPSSSTNSNRKNKFVKGLTWTQQQKKLIKSYVEFHMIKNACSNLIAYAQARNASWVTTCDTVILAIPHSIAFVLQEISTKYKLKRSKVKLHQKTGRRCSVVHCCTGVIIINLNLWPLPFVVHVASFEHMHIYSWITMNQIKTCKHTEIVKYSWYGLSAILVTWTK